MYFFHLCSIISSSIMRISFSWDFMHPIKEHIFWPSISFTHALSIYSIGFRSTYTSHFSQSSFVYILLTFNICCYHLLFSIVSLSLISLRTSCHPLCAFSPFLFFGASFFFMASFSDVTSFSFNMFHFELQNPSELSYLFLTTLNVCWLIELF